MCRAIRYEVNIPVIELRQCHCTDCQKVSGAGGTVNALIASSAFRVTHGEPRRFTKVADSGRTLHRFFCGDCGSPIYSQRELTPEMMTLRAGTLDNAPPNKVVAHIWTASARPWSHIDPATQRFPGQPDAQAVKK